MGTLYTTALVLGVPDEDVQWLFFELVQDQPYNLINNIFTNDEQIQVGKLHFFLTNNNAVDNEYKKEKYLNISHGF